MKRFHIVIATDGSAPGKSAVRAAVRFPWPDQSRASVVVAMGSRPSAAAGRAAQLTATRTVAAVARRWPEAVADVVDGAPAQAVIAAASRRRASIIVIGSRGYGRLRRMLTGSVSREVVRKAPCTVLVVRGTLESVRRIVVGVDGSAHARRAVALLARLSVPRGGRVTLFSVVDVKPKPSQALLPAGTRAAVRAEVSRINEARMAKAEQMLDEAARTLTQAGWSVDRVVTKGAPLRKLLATANKKRVDVIVVGAKGVSGVRQLLLGSVSEGVLSRGSASVLTVR